MRLSTCRFCLLRSRPERGFCTWDEIQYRCHMLIGVNNQVNSFLLPLTGPSAVSLESALRRLSSSKVKIVSASNSDFTTRQRLIAPSEEIEIRLISNGPSVSSYCHLIDHTGSVCLTEVVQRNKGSFDFDNRLKTAIDPSYRPTAIMFEYFSTGCYRILTGRIDFKNFVTTSLCVLI